MSDSLQQVVLGPSFTGCGYRPDFTPDHQVDLLTGMIAEIGGSAFGLPMICDNLSKQCCETRFCICSPSHLPSRRCIMMST